MRGAITADESRCRPTIQMSLQRANRLSAEHALLVALGMEIRVGSSKVTPTWQGGNGLRLRVHAVGDKLGANAKPPHNTCLLEYLISSQHP